MVLRAQILQENMIFDKKKKCQIGELTFKPNLQVKKLNVLLNKIIFFAVLHKREILLFIEACN